MADQIIRKLKKKPHPDGYFNFNFFICRLGEKDYKNSQLCNQNSCFQTPWLSGKVRCLAEYKNSTYCKVDEAIKPFSHVIASECKELEVLKKEEMVREGLDSENEVRSMAMCQSKKQEKEKCISDICIHLSELKAEIETIDATLQHHLQCAQNVILQHVSSYWSGILKAASDTEIPAMPDVETSDIVGEKIYEMHLKSILEKLNKVLMEE